VEWLEVARYYVTSGFFFFWLRLGAKRWEQHYTTEWSKPAIVVCSSAS
jgi:hypothetical protein